MHGKAGGEARTLGLLMSRRPFDQAPGRLQRPPFTKTDLARIDLQDQVNLGAVVELADGLGIAFVVLELGVHLIVDSRSERGEAIAPVFTYNIRLHRASPGVRNINYRIGEGIIVVIQNLSE